MSAKDLATTAVENGMSILRAAKEYGIHFSTLQYHLNLQKRVSSTDVKQRESVIATAIESVDGVVLKGVEFREALKKRQMNLKNKRALKTLNSPKKLPKTRQKVTKKPASKTKPKRVSFMGCCNFHFRQIWYSLFFWLIFL